MARAATPETTILGEGDVLVVPAGWWCGWRALAHAAVLRRRFVSPRALPAALARGRAVEAAVDEFAAAEDPDTDVYVRAELHKKQGNAWFTQGRVREARGAYSRAIALLRGAADFCFDEAAAGRGNLAVYYCNRAACHLQLKDFDRAVADCNEVLRAGRCDGVAVKALFRRGKAHEGLGDVKPAYRDFQQVVALEPNNRAALEELDQYASVMHRLLVKHSGTPANRAKAENLLCL